MVNFRRNTRSGGSHRRGGNRAWGGGCLLAPADLGDPEALDAMFDAVGETFGSLDILVANAAATAFKPLLETRRHHLDKTFAITVNALVHAVQRAAGLMQGRAGKVVTVSGIDARRYVPLHGAMAAAKGAAEVLTAYLACELAPRGIRVNGVNPGFVDTDSARVFGDTRLPPAGRQHRPLHPHEAGRRTAGHRRRRGLPVLRGRRLDLRPDADGGRRPQPDLALRPQPPGCAEAMTPAPLHEETHAMPADAEAFVPFPLLRGPHAQTIAAAKLALWRRRPPAESRVVALPDGDRIALEVSTPRQWRPDDPSVLLLHGLCGCHDSPYMTRVALKLWRRGVRAIRMNMRGCGSGVGLARMPYHSGRSADVEAVLEDLRAAWPHSALTLVGFSLGGNVMLKLAGELGKRAGELAEQVIAVCPPADLASLFAAAQPPVQPRLRAVFHAPPAGRGGRTPPPVPRSGAGGPVRAHVDV